MFVHNIDPVLFRIFGLEIRYYGIIYALGFLITLWFCLKAVEKDKLKLTKDDVYDFFLYLVIGVVLGARLFEVLFYNPGYYFSNPKEIIMIWHGGLSFHGGLVGAIAVVYWYTKKKGISFYDISDLIVIPAALALAFGRIANFINGELVGKVTSLPWGVKFKGYEGFRHPTQVYESLKNFIIFGILLSLRNKNLPKGFMTWLFLVLYSFIRFFIEFLKEPESLYSGVPTGQWLSGIGFAFGLYMLYNASKKT